MELLTCCWAKSGRPSDGQFGLWPFLAGTCWVTGFAILLAVPVCLLAAIYLAEYAGDEDACGAQTVDRSALAGIPSVVYGVWGMLVVVPFIADVLGPYAATHWQRIFRCWRTDYTTGY